MDVTIRLLSSQRPKPLLTATWKLRNDQLAGSDQGGLGAARGEQ